MQLITRHYGGGARPDDDPVAAVAGLVHGRPVRVAATTPIWRALKYPITTSIVISLTVGLFEIPNVLSLPKILGFLPFYVVGMHMSREWFERLTRVRCASSRRSFCSRRS